MSNYVTADLHLSHGNIIKYCHRPFLAESDKEALERMGGTWHQGDWKGSKSSSWTISEEAIEWMNADILGNINKTVGEDDTLWILGDLAYGIRQGYYEACRRHRNKIKCRNVILIWGNHDKRTIRDLFKFTTDLISTEIADRLITMCHYSMTTWDQSHRGSIQLYGHSHSNAEDWLDEIMPGRRSMDVGVDNAFRMCGEFRPFCIETEIIPWMLARPGAGTKKVPQVKGPTEAELLNRSDG